MKKICLQQSLVHTSQKQLLGPLLNHAIVEVSKILLLITCKLLLFFNEQRRRHAPYLTWQMSPTSRSLTGTCSTSPPLMVANLCSCSILLCSPRNCRSLRQSLNAVTRTTTTTATRIAIPSIHSAFDSESSCSISVQQQQ